MMRSFSKFLRLLTNLIVIILLQIFLCSNVMAQDQLTNKLMMGYQGWFLCEGDGSPLDYWVHWFNSQSDPSLENLGIDFWPEMAEYTDSYATKMTKNDGSPAKLFSAYDLSTVKVHFKWMQDYGIHGVYLQRFLGPLENSGIFGFRNKVLENVIEAAGEYDRHFAVMYDISGVPDDGDLDNKLISDWEYLVDTYDVLNKDGYVYQDGRPVIAIWGIGFHDRGLNPETFEQIIDYFHNSAEPKYQAYVMGGVPSRWRTLEHDSESDPAWRNVYNSLDMISPWTVGRYHDQDEIDDWKEDRIIPDLDSCNANGVDYMPVIWPGFSWKNINDGPLNAIPRNGGKHYWRQAYNAIDAGVEFIYVAMFDEVDEGTAMFKLAETQTQLPVEAQGKPMPNRDDYENLSDYLEAVAESQDSYRLVTLDADGYVLPSDWYLRLAGETQKMLGGNIELTSTIPIKPFEEDYLSRCDSPKGWNSANSLSINITDNKKGSGCIQSIGSETDEFSKEFPWSFSAGSSTSLGFWYYVSDVDQFDTDNQVELGSGGELDVNEYHWSLAKEDLNNGWNYINLEFSDATVTGGEPDLDAINWFRIYHVKTGEIITMIDDIQIRGTGGNQAPIADAGPDYTAINTSNAPDKLVTLDASASTDFDGEIVSYSWQENGTEIASGEKPSVNLSMGTHLITLIVTDDDGATGDDEIEIIVKAEIDDCDEDTGWDSGNSLNINTSDQKRGDGCLESVGNNTDDFKKSFPFTFAVDSSTSLGFWYYVSDVTLFGDDNQVELGSGGEANVNEYHWTIDKAALNNGWNYVNLYFSDAEVTGGEPDLEALNWFRLYRAKSGNLITRIDNVKLRGGSGNQEPVADAGPGITISSDSTGSGSVTLDGSRSIDFDGEIVSYSWSENDIEIATGEAPTVSLSASMHMIKLTVTDDVGATDADMINVNVSGNFLDNCDSKEGWSSHNALSVNTTDQKQGTGCLEAVGNGTDEFKKVFAPAFTVDDSASLEFWYYISDVSLFESANQVELGSDGGPDKNEYSWSLNNNDLQTGWNHIVLKLSDAGVSGNAPDLNGINWFRLYHFKSGNMTTRIDAIRFTGGQSNQLPIADAGPDQTVSDNGNGSASVILDGSGSFDYDGEIVNYSWEEDSVVLGSGKNPVIDLSVGTHNIDLIITDDGGATASDMVSITVEESVSIDEETAIPERYFLSQNYPNPFNPSTTIRYGLKENVRVKISIYNLSGKLMETIIDRPEVAGYHQVEWNAANVSSGIYFYKIDAGNKFRAIQKCILIK